jgi:protocatechuate 3,4-dioxygenase beta subunit
MLDRPNRPPEQGSFYQRDRVWQPRTLDPQYKSSTVRSPSKPLIALDNTLSELTGPVFGHDMLGELDNDLIRNYSHGGDPIGPRIVVHGRLLDQNGRGVAGALVEVWQANAGGRYRHRADDYIAALDPNFGGCGRTITDEDGAWRLRTIQPGPYPWPNRVNDWRPAHIHFSVLGRGFAQRMVTQMYFEGDPLIALCPIVGTLSSPEAVDRLTARFDIANTVPMDTRAWRFDIVLRGRRATPFENRPEGT